MDNAFDINFTKVRGSLMVKKRSIFSQKGQNWTLWKGQVKTLFESSKQLDRLGP